MIGRELREFLESGLSVIVGTRDRRLVPEAARGFGVRVAADGRSIELFLPRAWSARTLDNLRDNGRIAVSVARPEDHRSVQVKGRLIEIRDGSDADLDAVERYRELLVPSWGFVGIPAAATRRVAAWPCDVARIEVESLFEQTPGPHAGDPLRDGGGSAP